MLVLYGCGFHGCNGLGSPSSIRIGWTVYLSSFLSLSLFVMVPVVAFFPYSVCATPTLFVLFAPVFALLSARCRYPSIRSSVFRSSRCSVLSVLSYSAQFIEQSERALHHFPLTPTPSPSLPCCLSTPLYPVPDRRATAYCTYVFSAICVLVRYSTLSLSSLDCASIFRFVFGRLLWSVEPEVPERKRHQICTWLCPTSSTSETVAGASGDLRFAACCGLVASLDPRQLFRAFRSGP